MSDTRTRTRTGPEEAALRRGPGQVCRGPSAPGLTEEPLLLLGWCLKREHMFQSHLPTTRHIFLGEAVGVFHAGAGSSACWLLPSRPSSAPATSAPAVCAAALCSRNSFWHLSLTFNLQPVSPLLFPPSLAELLCYIVNRFFKYSEWCREAQY